MKKFIILAITALLMITVASFAKEIITEKDLADVTAESGVSVSLNNVNTGSVYIDTISWGDGDGSDTYGSGTYNSAGYGGIRAANITGTLASFNGDMTLDVGTSGTSTRAQIVMPTVTLGNMDFSTRLKLSPNIDLVDGSASGENQRTLGRVDMRSFSTQAQGSIKVYAH
jgi:hypothetical protein